MDNLSRCYRGLALKTTFQLVAGHPAVDLVNTLDWRFRENAPEELLKSYDDLLRFSQEAGVLTAKQTRQARRAASPRALKRCIELREAIAEILYARLDGRDPLAVSLKTLERSIQAARIQQQLIRRQAGFQWEWGGNRAELPLWALSMSASDLLFSEAVERVRACCNPGCRWLFLDTSKNHSRRWCDMKLCGNRMKARRFKAQRKS
jgi:predicted RNA-binding Zn ribbon-like protein